MGFIYITGSRARASRRCSRSARSTASATRRRGRQQLGSRSSAARSRSEALDTRLKLLQAQIEPHFLFNTLANVQALVESGSPQAAPVLKSLIAYLRAAMPRLHAGASTLGDETRPGARLPRADADAHARPARSSRSTCPRTSPALRFPPMAC